MRDSEPWLHDVLEIAHGIQGWLTDRQIGFLYRCALRASGGAIVEIGSFCGKSTVVLALGTRAGHQLPIYAIDPHIGSVEQLSELNGRSSEEIFRQNLDRAGASRMVTPIVQRSDQVGRVWDKPIAFLWIDGDHSYEGAKADFDLFSPWVVDGGIIAFHDCDGEPVARAMSESFRQVGYGKIGNVDTITYAIKGARKSMFDRGLLTLRANSSRLGRMPGMAAIKAPVKAWLSKLALKPLVP